MLSISKFLHLITRSYNKPKFKHRALQRHRHPVSWRSCICCWFYWNESWIMIIYSCIKMSHQVYTQNWFQMYCDFFWRNQRDAFLVHKTISSRKSFYSSTFVSFYNRSLIYNSNISNCVPLWRCARLGQCDALTGRRRPISRPRQSSPEALLVFRTGTGRSLVLSIKVDDFIPKRS